MALSHVCCTANRKPHHVFFWYFVATQVLNFPLADLDEVLETEIRLIDSGRSFAERISAIDLISPYHFVPVDNRNEDVVPFYDAVRAYETILNGNLPNGLPTTEARSFPRIEMLALFSNLTKLAIYEFEGRNAIHDLPMLPNLTDLSLQQLRSSSLGMPFAQAFPSLSVLHVAALQQDVHYSATGLYLPVSLKTVHIDFLRAHSTKFDRRCEWIYHMLSTPVATSWRSVRLEAMNLSSTMNDRGPGWTNQLCTALVDLLPQLQTFQMDFLSTDQFKSLYTAIRGNGIKLHRMTWIVGTELLWGSLDVQALRTIAWVGQTIGTLNSVHADIPFQYWAVFASQYALLKAGFDTYERNNRWREWHAAVRTFDVHIDTVVSNFNSNNWYIQDDSTVNLVRELRLAMRDTLMAALGVSFIADYSAEELEKLTTSGLDVGGIRYGIPDFLFIRLVVMEAMLHFIIIGLEEASIYASRCTAYDKWITYVP